MSMTQEETAEWMGVSVERMNYMHDRLHQVLADLCYFPSYALKVAAGESLTHEEYCLANYEEDAVLHLQRYFHKVVDHIHKG